MTGDTIECFNCGRQNPEWAQICRSCGVRLDPALGSGGRPSGAFPTDQRSLVSMGAALGTIVLGVLLALFLSGLDPFDPAAARESPTAEPEPQPSASLEPEPIPSASMAVEPVASSPPSGPPGTLTFGTGLDANQQVIEPTDTYGPAEMFAYTIEVPEPFGVPRLGIQVVEIAADGSEQEVIAPADNGLDVDPAATIRGVICCEASYLIGQLGPGQYLMRAYADAETVLAEGRFLLSEG